MNRRLSGRRLAANITLSKVRRFAVGGISDFTRSLESTVHTLD